MKMLESAKAPSGATFYEGNYARRKNAAPDGAQLKQQHSFLPKYCPEWGCS
jgi:hypothetical protein